MDEALRRQFLKYQINELTESRVYRSLARVEKNPENKRILEQIASDEERHYALLKTYTGEDVSPKRGMILKFHLIARTLGITFALKLMESGEGNAHRAYGDYPELAALADDEEIHEGRLINLISEEKLTYMGSVVLGLNDALVEFTGALAGFTLALSSSKLIALTGAITGIAAALSMASSEYLSTKSEGGETKHPVKASFYTGMAYVFTVALLVAPYALIENVLYALILMLVLALSIIAAFNYYYCIARTEPFGKRFGEMAILSFSVAGVSFLIGYALKTWTGIEA